MEPLVQKYIDAKPIELPTVHPDGFSLENFSVFCAKCHKEADSLRGTSTIVCSCIEVEAAGVCKDCRCVTWSKFRFYGDRILHWSDRGIQEHKCNPSWLVKLEKFLGF